MRNVIITGSNGQLGQCLRQVVSESHPAFQYIFLSKFDLDFRDVEQSVKVFEKYQPAYCINCAAYTAVDQAEEEADVAFAINELAVKSLAEVCVIFDTILLHVSTDFVFNGDSSIPLTEDLETNPVNIYGLSKLKGELEIQQLMKHYFIIRTSWLYSENANNFVKTMLKLSETREQLTVIYDQIGTPTYAMDLATVLIRIIENGAKAYGLYHYSNEGVASWYDFAKAVFELANKNTKVLPVASSAFVTKAKRPHYSVLDKSKIKAALGIEIPYWRDSLNNCIKKL